MSKYDLLTKPYEQDLLKSLSDLVSFNSVLDPSTIDKENPFGKGVSAALQYIENLAKKDGFVVNNYSNMVVEILCGTGKKNITILAHADIVPVGTGWERDPLTVFEKDGVLYGRGVADDKGPLLASYYALKALRDNNLIGDYTVRFLAGGNEETGSRGMLHYFYELKKEQPDLGFSPDAEFPLIFAEKGIFDFKVCKKLDLKNVYSIKGGVATNCVIEKCDVLLDKDEKFVEYLKTNNIKFELSENGDKYNISFIGKAAHGSVPQFGINAGMIAIRELGNFYGIEEFKELYLKFEDVFGRGINAYSQSIDMGENSSNIGIMNYENGEFVMIDNFRFVDTADQEELKKNILASLKDFEVKMGYGVPVLHYPKDSVLVQTLLKAYQEETGDYETPIMAIGGGTYAKVAKNIVAFGMDFPGWNSNMHSPGEQVKVSALFKGMSIYANAIVALGEKLNEN